MWITVWERRWMVDNSGKDRMWMSHGVDVYSEDDSVNSVDENSIRII